MNYSLPYGFPPIYWSFIITYALFLCRPMSRFWRDFKQHCAQWRPKCRFPRRETQERRRSTLFWWNCNVNCLRFLSHQIFQTVGVGKAIDITASVSRMEVRRYHGDDCFGVTEKVLSGTCTFSVGSSSCASLAQCLQVIVWLCCHFCRTEVTEKFWTPGPSVVLGCTWFLVLLYLCICLCDEEGEACTGAGAREF